jgi:hypothetical protein
MGDTIEVHPECMERVTMEAGLYSLRVEVEGTHHKI